MLKSKHSPVYVVYIMSFLGMTLGCVPSRSTTFVTAPSATEQPSAGQSLAGTPARANGDRGGTHEERDSAPHNTTEHAGRRGDDGSQNLPAAGRKVIDQDKETDGGRADPDRPPTPETHEQPSEGGDRRPGDAHRGGHSMGGLPVDDSTETPNERVMPCGDEIRVYDINVEGQRIGTRYEWTGTTSTMDNFQGSCTDEATSGSEAIAAFRAPSSGAWSIRTLDAPGAFDTVIYARSDCQDNPSELACNDDVATGQLLQSRLVLDLVEGQDILIFIDHFNGLSADSFTLHIEPAIDNPTPILEEGLYIVDTDRRTAALRLRGHDDARDVYAARVRIRDPAGALVGNIGGNGLVVFMNRIGYQVSSRLEWDDGGRLTAWVTLTLGPETNMNDFFEFEAQLLDRDGQVSAWQTLSPGVAENVADGDACDDVTLVCHRDQICVPDGARMWRCQDGDAAPRCPEDWTITALQPDDDGVVNVEGNNVDSTIQWSGQCGGGGGPDVYRYTAQTDGTLLFKADGIGDETDPVIYLRQFCQYAVGPSGTDHACNTDRSSTDTGATVSMALRTGEHVFIYVDSNFEGVDVDGDGRDDQYRRRGEGPYRLTVEPASPPNLERASASFNRLTTGFAMRLHWTDRDADVVEAGVIFVDRHGNALPMLTEVDGETTTTGFIQLTEVVEREDIFSAEIAIDLSEQFNLILDLDRVAAIQVFVRDASGLSSSRRAVELTAPPVMADGARCDPKLVQNRCPDDRQVCAIQLGVADTPRCVSASAPIIESATIIRGWQNGVRAIGVHVIGEDEERNAQGLILDFYDRDGTLFLSRAFALPSISTINGDVFNGSGTLIVNETLPDDFETMRVSLYDSTALVSASILGQIDDPSPIPLGEPCLPNSLLARCVSPALCLPNAVLNRCQMVQSTCPAEWAVTPLTRVDDGPLQGWSAIARAQPVPIDTLASCGRQVPSPTAIFSVSLDVDTVLTCRVDRAPVHRPVFYARSHCGVDHSSAELACVARGQPADDSVDTPQIQFQKRANQVVYLFVELGLGPFEDEIKVTCESAE
ncbi:MAG: hypothetical protein VX589_00790 [Myxococcota bacterium]|nr:hypothetical protein [Myxococcota bacterium]